jgi:hypothetical protein
VGSATVFGALGAGTGTALATSASNAAAPAAFAAAAAPVFGMPLVRGLTCPVPYLSRAGWGADEELRNQSPSGYWPIEEFPIQTLTVHHGGVLAGNDSVGQVQGVYYYQCIQRDFGDIGYHLLIDRQGVVFEGRWSGGGGPIFGPDGLMVTGAHVKYLNSGNFGVCLLGWLDSAHDGPPTAAQWDSLVKVLAYVAVLGGVEPLSIVNYVNPVSGATATINAITGHGLWPGTNTECPALVKGMFGQLRQAVAGAMASVPTPDPWVPPSPDPTPSASAEPTPTPTPEPTPAPTPTETPAATPSATPSSGPSPSSQATPPATQTPPATPSATPSPRGGSREGKGDEYVAKDREKNPDLYKPPAPSTSATAVTATSRIPSTRAPRPVNVAAADTSGPNWGISAAAAVGVAAVAAVGGWVLQRRRAALATAAPSAPSLVTLVQSTVDIAAAPTTADFVSPASPPDLSQPTPPDLSQPTPPDPSQPTPTDASRPAPTEADQPEAASAAEPSTVADQPSPAEDLSIRPPTVGEPGE